MDAAKVTFEFDTHRGTPVVMTTEFVAGPLDGKRMSRALDDADSVAVMELLKQIVNGRTR